MKRVRINHVIHVDTAGEAAPKPDVVVQEEEQRGACHCDQPHQDQVYDPCPYGLTRCTRINIKASPNRARGSASGQRHGSKQCNGGSSRTLQKRWSKVDVEQDEKIERDVDTVHVKPLLGEHQSVLLGDVTRNNAHGGSEAN